ncbi:MAG: hypothetical protein HY520_04680 [Candidatus Aenigmarchaeota archaeon]|nr:hypothetical protein [Candidatus Aenigmarchaeota archaeon]
MKVLRILCKKLNKSDVKWVIGGSVSLALQGVDTEPHDVDILTDEKGAYELNKILKEYEISKVKFSKTDIIASHFGKFKINGFTVEVIGDYMLNMNGQWVNFGRKRINEIIMLNVDDIEVPISSLKSQLESSKIMGRTETVKKIEDVLTCVK